MGIEYVRGGIEKREQLSKYARMKREREDPARSEKQRRDRENHMENLKRERHAVLRKRGTIGKRIF